MTIFRTIRYTTINLDIALRKHSVTTVVLRWDTIRHSVQRRVPTVAPGGARRIIRQKYNTNTGWGAEKRCPISLTIAIIPIIYTYLHAPQNAHWKATQVAVKYWLSNPTRRWLTLLIDGVILFVKERHSAEAMQSAGTWSCRSNELTCATFF